MKLLFFFSLGITALHSLPHSMEVTEGKGACRLVSPGVLEVIADDRSIFQWGDFSVNAGEKVHFVQPRSDATVLNRVVGMIPSRIDGMLDGNGQVYLINPNGVIFGRNGSVDTASFFASTLDVLDSAFLEGKTLVFEGTSEASIINEGTIHSEESYLFAASVDNKGTLIGEKSVGIATSGRVVFTPDAKQRIHIALEKRECSKLINEGQIRGAQVELHASPNLYSFAFSHEGTIDATGIREVDGIVYLTAEDGLGEVAGSISAKRGDAGGDVYLLGERLILRNGSEIDVSGKTKGGTLLCGGDYQGQNPDVPNSKHLFIEEGALIKADALLDGHGGKVIFWADESNSFFGNISARAGTLSGDGGFAEISSPILAFQGMVDLTSPFGKAGDLLLDPTDITIGGATDAGVVIACPTTWPGPGTPVNISGPAIAAILAAGTNVCISTSTPPNLGVNGDVLVNIPGIIWGGVAPGSLTITADRDITISTGAAIASTTSGGNITLTAARHIQMRGNVTNRAIAAPGAAISLTATTGDINIQEVAPFLGFTTTIGTNFGSTSVRTLAGSITIRAPNGFNTWAGIGPSDLPVISVSSDITVEAAQNLSIFGAGTLIPGGNNNTAIIGRSPIRALPSTTSVLGNTTVAVGGNLILNGGIGGAISCYAIIGEVTATMAPLSQFIGDITVGVRGNATLTGSNGAFSRGVIGADPGLASDGDIRSNLLLNVGGTLLLQGGVPSGGEDAFVGYNTDDGFGSTATASTSIRINIGGDFYLDARACRASVIAAYSDPMVDPGYDPISYIHCGGNIFLLGGQPTRNGGQATFSTRHVESLITDFTYHVWAGGSIRCLNGNGVGGAAAATRASLQESNGSYYNHSYRATGDIIQGGFGNYASVGAGSFDGTFSGYFIEADTCFAAGELWTPQSATVNGVNILAATPLGTTSAATVCNQTGAFAIDSLGYDLSGLPVPYNGAQLPVPVATGPLGSVNYLTGVGDFTLHSSAQFFGESFRAMFAPGNPADLVHALTAGGSELYTLSTAGGNIEISGSDGPTLGGCGCTDSFRNITIVDTQPVWTTGSIYISANNNLTSVLDDIVGGPNPITLISDYDDTGVGNLLLGRNVTSTGGVITLDAGFGSAGGTSSIQITNTAVISTLNLSPGAPIIMQAVSDILISGAANTSTSGVGSQSIESTHGNVLVDENVVATTGSITVVAGIGNILIGTATGTGGSFSTTTGDISLDAGTDIEINGDPLSILSATGSISTIAGNDTRQTENVATAGPILMISGNNMFMFGVASIASSASEVTVVVDNDFPAAPLIGLGFFDMAAGASISSAGLLQIYTARQQFNSILGTLNGLTFGPPNCGNGPLYSDSLCEIWCTYFDNGAIGTPFTVYYKDCLQQATEEAMLIVDQLMDGLDSFDDLSPWWRPMIQNWRFKIWYAPFAVKGSDSSLNYLPDEPYWISMPSRRYINLPIITNDAGPAPGPLKKKV